MTIRNEIARAGALMKLTVVVLIVAFLSLPCFGAEQIVIPTPVATVAGGSTLVSADVYYSSANPQNVNLTGLGLRMHYDSTKLSLVTVASVFPPGFVSLNPQADTSNFDGDASTNQFVLVSWADIGGHWPGSEPQRLFNAQFTTLAGFSGITHVRFSASSTATGYVLSATPWRIASYAVSRSDFNVDGRSDIFWRNAASGQTSVWLMNATTFSGVVLPGSVPAPWAPAVGGDFDSDGRWDVLWRNPTTGETSIWSGWNGTTFATQVRSTTVPTVWVPVGSGDINADGRTDIMWRNTSTGQNSIWFMNGSAFTGVVLPGSVPTTWGAKVCTDLDADGRADVVWRNVVTGETSLWLGWNGSDFAVQVRSTTVPTAWSLRGTGDINGDLKSDLFWHNLSTGETSIWFMNGTAIGSAVRATTVSTTWTPTVFGDFNGDGKSDIFWRKASTGETSVWLGWNGTTFATQAAVMTVPTAWAPSPL